MTDPTDVLERAQAWLQAADERGINRTDKDGYLSVIEDLVAEVEFNRVALQGYRNRLNSAAPIGVGWNDGLGVFFWRTR